MQTLRADAAWIFCFWQSEASGDPKEQLFAGLCFGIRAVRPRCISEILPVGRTPVCQKCLCLQGKTLHCQSVLGLNGWDQVSRRNSTAAKLLVTSIHTVVCSHGTALLLCQESCSCFSD